MKSENYFIKSLKVDECECSTKSLQILEMRFQEITDQCNNIF